MSGVAIIDHAGPDPGIAHDYAHTWWIRDRLDRAQGHHDNEVLWFGPAPLIGDPNWPTEALLAMDGWLAAVERDHSNAPLAQKIVDNKPAELQDRCTADLCEQYLATRYGTPRSVAGGDAYNDIVKCQLKPLDRAELRRPRLLHATSSGRSWSRPSPTACAIGASRASASRRRISPGSPTRTGTGNVIYGGKPMRPAPQSRPLR